MARAFRIFGRRQVLREVDDELAFHLDMRARKLIDGGMDPDDARREAARQFGNLGAVRDSCVAMDQERERAMRRADFLGELRHDLGFAARMLRRNPGFAAIVILTLGLGIGANTAIFTLVNAVILRPLPVHAPRELVGIGNPARTGSLSIGSPRADIVSWPIYTDLRDHNHLVTGLAATGRVPRLDVTVDAPGGQATAATTAIEHPRGRLVSSNYFSVLGVTAAAGRLFDDAGDRAGRAEPVVVISHAYWTRRFQNDPSAVGRTLSVNGTAFTIIGVAQEGFDGEIVGRLNDLFLPALMQPAVQPRTPMLANRTISWLLLIGRLAPGVSMDQARTGFTQLITQSVGDNTTGGPAVVKATVEALDITIEPAARGFSSVRSSYQAPLFTLMAGVALLLLIICGNVANLLLARAVARSREMSVRMAIGARRGRLVRQLLTESLVLAVLGAAAGLAVAIWGSRFLLALAADGGTAILLDTALDLRVLAFTGVLSILAVAFFGLAPALRASRVDLASTMRAHARSVGGFGGRAPLGRLLIGGQVALSVVLLVGAALLVQSLRAVENTDPGLDRDHLLIVSVDAVSRGYADQRLAALAHDVNARLIQVPGVAAGSYSENGIFSGTESATGIQVAGFTAHQATDSVAYYDNIGPGYIHAIGGRLLAGREFTEADRLTSANVIVINETMAKFYWKGADAVGQTVHFNDTTAAEVVGVVADTKDHRLTGESVRRFYQPYDQAAVSGNIGNLRWELRATGDPAALTTVVKREILAIDPQLTIDAIDPLSVLMRQSIREERLVARLATGFGVLALLLAAIGLYGVMTYAITRRTGEIGLRVALGAQRSAVLGMVLGDALKLVGLGVAAGVPLALGATRLLQGQLHGVSSADPLAIGIALIVLGVSATLAALLPALRASRVAPLVALRQE
jgi:predicted permease